MPKITVRKVCEELKAWYAEGGVYSPGPHPGSLFGAHDMTWEEAVKDAIRNADIACGVVAETPACRVVSSFHGSKIRHLATVAATSTFTGTRRALCGRLFGEVAEGQFNPKDDCQACREKQEAMA